MKTNRSMASVSALLATIVLLPNSHAAEESCSITDRSGSVVLMYCPAELEDRSLGEQGRAACEPGALCNVWVWNDKAKMPEKAPTQDQDLPRTSTAEAVAIWVNDSESLIRLRKASSNE